MARIAGVTVPLDKRIEIALQYIYGVGSSRAREALIAAHIDPNVRTKDLSADDVNRLREYIEKSFKVEGELRRETQSNVKRLKEIGSYRGARHARNLPVRGQRTKTNSRTVRGNVRRTMGSGKRKLEKT
ncbi:30S ribosomal protein S13 [Candidatus Uhrbacteria bacterium]|nr:30S ribosomal protein S13 [Candidatus Uhrbacteria bacterium]